MFRHKGFTLVELMVTIAIAAILLGIALPGFAEFLRGVRASGDVSALTSALALARSEAVKRNQVACVFSSDWAGGWDVRVDSSGNGSCGDAGDGVVRVFSAPSTTGSLSVKEGSGDADEIIFNGTGRRQGGEFVIAYRSEAGACNPRRDRNLTVGPTGRTQIEACTP